MLINHALHVHGKAAVGALFPVPPPTHCQAHNWSEYASASHPTVDNLEQHIGHTHHPGGECLLKVVANRQSSSHKPLPNSTSNNTQATAVAPLLPAGHVEQRPCTVVWKVT
jgi:hypothetical protein